MPEQYTIGTLAKQAGVNVETIRYYQRRGLVSEPDRPLGGIRRYAPTHARRLHFIKHAQTLGFTLEEVADLLALESGQFFEPHDTEYGLREGAHVDRDGNLIRFGSAIQSRVIGS
jgi:MerR family mercuric resistance operon transcriptional regulator